MGRQFYLGRGLQRLLCELLRSVAGHDMTRAQRLLRDLHQCGALARDAGGYTRLDLDTARASLACWLSTEEVRSLREAHADTAAGCATLLALLDRSGVATPVSDTLLRASHQAIHKSLEQGLLRRSRRDLSITARGRLALWLAADTRSQTPQAQARDLATVLRGISRLRADGRWHDAARLSTTVLDYDRAGDRPWLSLVVTAAIGLAHAQEYGLVLSTLDPLLGLTGRPTRVPEPWRNRLTALWAFVLAEDGQLEGAAGVLAESRTQSPCRGAERLWPVLATAWLDIRNCRYRRADRVLAFVGRRLPPGSHWLHSVVSSWRAVTAYYLERYDESSRLYQHAVEAARQSGWHDRKLAMTRNLASNDLEVGQLERAGAVLTGLLCRHETEGNMSILPSIWAEIGRLYARSDDRPWAWALNRALRLGQSVGAWHQVVVAHGELASRARAAGRWDSARHHYLEVKRLAGRTGHRFMVGTADFQLSRLMHYTGRREEALGLLDEALQVFADTDQMTRCADVHRQKAEFLLEDNRFDEARHQLDAAEAIYSRRSWVREAGFVPLLRLELKLRSTPGDISEADLDRIPTEQTDTSWQAAMACALLAVGFGILADLPTTRHYARETLAQLRKISDIHYNYRILDLARCLSGESPTLGFLASFWAGTLDLPPSQEDPGAGTDTSDVSKAN